MQYSGYDALHELDRQQLLDKIKQFLDKKGA